MRVKQMEHYDVFWEDITCWIEVEDVQDYFKFCAKNIDGEAYMESCFGICVGKDEGGWYVCQDGYGCELFYIDDDGEKNWMPYVLTDEEKKQAIEFCQKYIEERMM